MRYMIKTQIECEECGNEFDHFRTGKCKEQKKRFCQRCIERKQRERRKLRREKCQ